MDAEVSTHTFLTMIIEESVCFMPLNYANKLIVSYNKTRLGPKDRLHLKKVFGEFSILTDRFEMKNNCLISLST
jgi:hypothetical protein